MDNLVSVVLASHNGEKYLLQQIESILSQTYTNIELIICDDFSSDESLNIARKFEETDKRVRVVENKQNLGIVQNFLKGLRYAQGKYICFSDQDDIWLNDKVQVLISHMKLDNEVSLAYSDLEICNDSLTEDVGSFWEITGIGGEMGKIGEKAFLKNISPGCAMMFREDIKKHLVELPLDVPFMHDHLAFVLASLVGKITAITKKLVKYRQHSSNNIGAFYDSKITSDRIRKELKEKIYFFKNNHFLNNKFKDKIEEIEKFYESFSSRKLSKRKKFLEYYVFLRGKRGPGRMLAILDCFFPRLYESLKYFSRNLKSEKIFKIFSAVIFSLWAVVVLVFFTKEFVVNKIVTIFGGQ